MLKDEARSTVTAMTIKIKQKNLSNKPLWADEAITKTLGSNFEAAAAAAEMR